MMRWPGFCHGCQRSDVEVETRYDHYAKTLCDRCAAKTRRLSTRPTVAANPTTSKKREADISLEAPPTSVETTNVSGDPSLSAQVLPPFLTSSLPNTPSKGDAEEPAPSEAAERQEPEVEELLRRYADKVEPAALPALPQDATPAMSTVAGFYATVLSLRRFAGLPDATPFAVDWVAKHCDMPGMTVSRALRKLHEAGVITWGGETLRYPKTRLWLPGAVAVGADAVIPDRAVQVEAPPVRQWPSEPVAEDDHPDPVDTAETDDGTVGVPSTARDSTHARHGTDAIPGPGAQCAIFGWDDD